MRKKLFEDLWDTNKGALQGLLAQITEHIAVLFMISIHADGFQISVWVPVGQNRDRNLQISDLFQSVLSNCSILLQIFFVIFCTLWERIVSAKKNKDYYEDFIVTRTF